MLKEAPRVWEMVQSPLTPLDQEQAPEMQNIGYKPFQASLDGNTQEYIEDAPSDDPSDFC